MTATQAERNRASSIRKKSRAGKPVSPAEHEWLADYEARYPGAGRRDVEPVAASPAPPTPPAAPVEPAPPQSPAMPPTPPAAPPGRVTIDFGAPPGDGQTQHSPTGSCSIPDCPACKLQRGAQICGTTGAKVWPPMSEAGAKGFASLVLSGLTWLLRMFREDRWVPTPTTKERDELAKALRELALRRASWLGAVDDIIAVAFLLGAFTMRVMNEPRPKELASNGS